MPTWRPRRERRAAGEAHRLERLAGLCHRHPSLAEAVLSGRLSMARADRLADVANPEREPWLADSLSHLLGMDGLTDDDWSAVVRQWATLVDHERSVRQVPRHSLTMTQRLFGRRRRPHRPARPPRRHPPTPPEGRGMPATPSPTPHPRPLRRPGQRPHRPATLAGLRDVTDLDDLVLRGDGWRLTKEAAERLLCDSAMVAVLFDGKGHLLDANDHAERWTPRQRRAIAARDRCVFPSCTRPPRHCDVHHREHGGPTTTSNGALLCRFHHRLVHEHGWLSVIDGRWVATDPHGTRWTGRPRAPDQHTAKTPR